MIGYVAIAALVTVGCSNRNQTQPESAFLLRFNEGAVYTYRVRTRTDSASTGLNDEIFAEEDDPMTVVMELRIHDVNERDQTAIVASRIVNQEGAPPEVARLMPIGLDINIEMTTAGVIVDASDVESYVRAQIPFIASETEMPTEIVDVIVEETVSQLGGPFGSAPSYLGPTARTVGDRWSTEVGSGPSRETTEWVFTRQSETVKRLDFVSTGQTTMRPGVEDDSFTIRTETEGFYLLDAADTWPRRIRYVEDSTTSAEGFELTVSTEVDIERIR